MQHTHDARLAVRWLGATLFATLLTFAPDTHAQTTPSVTISAGSSSVNEGGTAAFTITASPTPAADITVNLNVTQEDFADLLPATHMGAQTVTVGTSGTATYTIPLKTNDRWDGNHLWQVQVVIADGSGYTVGRTDTAQIRVTGDQMAPTTPIVVIYLADPDAEASESDSATPAFTIVARPTPSPDPLTVNLTVTETGTSDRVAANDEGTQTVQVDTSAGTGSHTVPLQDNNDDAPDGTVQVALAAGTGYTLGPVQRQSARVPIRDDDLTTVDLAATSTTFDEGQSTTFTVTLGRQLVADERLTAELDPTNGNAQYPADFTLSMPPTAGVTFDPDTSGGIPTLTFTGPDAPATVTLTLETVDNNRLEEDKVIGISGTLLTADTLGGAAGWLNDTLNFTVAEATKPTLTIAPADPEPVVEGAAAEFTITADQAPASDLTITVQVSEDTALGQDYLAATAQGNRTVTLRSGDTTVTLSVDTGADSADEWVGTATATLQESAAYHVGDPASASRTLHDDDSSVLQLHLETTPRVIIEDGGTADVRIDLSQSTITVESAQMPLLPEGHTRVPDGQKIEVILNFTGGTLGTDFTLGLAPGADNTGVEYLTTAPGSATTPVVRFGPGASEAHLVFTALDDNTLNASDRDITLTTDNGLGFDRGGGVGITFLENQSIAFEDDEHTGPVTVGFKAATAEAPESAGHLMPVLTFSRALATPVTVPLTFSPGTATDREDYTTVSSLTVAATAEVTLSLPVRDDAVPEPHETFSVALDIAALNAADTVHTWQAGTHATATLTIQNDDPIQVELSTPDTTATESTDGAPSADTATIRLRLHHALAAGQSIAITLDRTPETGFTLALAGTPTGVAFDGTKIVTFTGPSDTEATLTLTAPTSEDGNAVDETVAVALGSLPADIDNFEIVGSAEAVGAGAGTITLVDSREVQCQATDTAVTAMISDTSKIAERAALAGDCTSLLNVQGELQGTVSLNWNTGTSMESWHGLGAGSVNASGRVAALSFDDTDPALNGTIPAALGDLDALDNLDLGGRGLTGTIPPELGNLTALVLLDLSQNQLEGAIPTTFNNLTELTTLNLHENELRGDIPDLSGLTKLVTLSLYDNQLTGPLPVYLNTFTLLEHLHLHENELRGDIPDLSGLSALLQLYLHGNRFSGFAANVDLSGLASLQHLHLHDNRFSGDIPATLGSLSALLQLYLHNNRFSGDIPAALDSLTSLTDLSLCGTALDTTATLPTALEARRTSSTLTVRACLSIEDVSAVEGRPLEFPVTLDTWPVRGSSSAAALTLDYTTADGTATSPADYTGTTTGSVTLPANTDTMTWKSSATISVPTVDDSRAESAETLTVTLSPPSSVVGLRQTATGTITDNDRRTRPPTGGGTGGGGGGGGLSDTHGNTPRTATPVAVNTQGVSPQRGQFVSPTDRDTFVFDFPWPGLLLIESQSGLDTRARLFDAALREVATDDHSGPRQNFRLGSAVAAGVYYLAVDSPRGSTGAYTLRMDYRPGYLEIPGPGSTQSGVSVLSGWICAAEDVMIEVETGADLRTWEAAYGTAREDTTPVCGDPATGYGLLFNWNELGAGAHTVRAVVDGVVLAEHAITVAPLGAEPFRRGLSGTYTLADFPQEGATTTVEWSEAQQNFVIATGALRRGVGDTTGPYPQLQFENPGPGTYQSGVGVISGWVCEAERVDVVITPERGEPVQVEAAYGTARVDTQAVCGDGDNGFGLLFNWNRLGAGAHVVALHVDGEAVAQSTIRVTTLGAEFARGLRGRYPLAGFPTPAEVVTIAWQQSRQNFGITGVE